MTRGLVVQEIYGPVWQGEGPSAGRCCSFVRFMGCNLDCDWAAAGGSLCDEAQTWKPGLDGWPDLAQRGRVMDAYAIADEACFRSAGMVILTGGETLLWQTKEAWGLLLAQLHDRGQRVEIETNGTILPRVAHSMAGYDLHFNVSPKLACSGVAAERRLVPAALDAFGELARQGRAVFKFVCASPGDVDEALGVARDAACPPAQVWIMPEGVTARRVLEVARLLAPVVLDRGFNLTLRQQVLLYDTAGEPREGIAGAVR